MNGYEALANGIIEQAVKDYRIALKALSRSPKNKAARAMKEEVEGFFRSDWFGVLTDINPEYLISKLCMEVETE